VLLFDSSADDWPGGALAVNALLARHAQHPVLIHFPIALFIIGVAFDLAGRRLKRRVLVDVAYYNLLAAAWSTAPALATGLLAWHYQLEGQRLEGALLQHLVLACASTVTIVLVSWMHARERRHGEVWSGRRVMLELLGVGLVVLTGHLGGFVSGVNFPG
jgi:uncharacterized membrane protein